MTVFIVEHSEIIRQGLRQILSKNQKISQILDFEDTAKVLEEINDKNPKCVIINPSLINNNSNFSPRQTFPNESTNFVAIVYSYVDNDVLKKYDAIIYINDNPCNIAEKLNNVVNKEIKTEKGNKVALSSREVDVLKLVVVGLTNKEIAEKLFISTHTVVSHRKNITSKLGIKTISGLTVYAILNKLINTDDIDTTN